MSYLLIGLGNPGEKYQGTRHNVGKMLARWLKAEGRRPKDEGSRMPEGFEMVETECFMNVSGNFVRKIIRNTQKTQRIRESDNQTIRSSDYQSIPSFPKLIIVHDDLDLRLGSFKIQFGKGPRLHNGVLSVEQALGTKEFWRVRIGIEGRRTKDEGRRTSGEGYVLEKFTAAEKKILEMVFPEIRDRLSSLSFLRKQESIPDQVRDKF